MIRIESEGRGMEVREDVQAAIQYVVSGQGEAMEVYLGDGL